MVLSEQSSHDSGHPDPACLLNLELSSSCLGDGIESRTAVVVGPAPAGAQKSPLLEAKQRRIQCSHVQTDGPFRHLLQAGCNGITVLRAHDVEDTKDHEVQCALKNFCPAVDDLSIRHSNRVYDPLHLDIK